MTKHDIAYVGDHDDNRIQLVDVATSAFLRTIGKRGAGVDDFNNVSGMTPNEKLNQLFVCDGNNNRIKIIDLTTDKTIKIIGGATAAPGEATFELPRGIEILSDNVIAVSEGTKIQLVSIGTGKVVETLSDGLGLEYAHAIIKFCVNVVVPTIVPPRLARRV